MDKVLLFGSKKDFAIQLGFTKKAEKYKLCFWIKNERYGSFTKAGELKYPIAEYKKIVADKSFLYLDIFDHLTPDEIFYYLVMIFLQRKRINFHKKTL